MIHKNEPHSSLNKYLKAYARRTGYNPSHGVLITPGLHLKDYSTMVTKNMTRNMKEIKNMRYTKISLIYKKIRVRTTTVNKRIYLETN